MIQPISILIYDKVFVRLNFNLLLFYRSLEREINMKLKDIQIPTHTPQWWCLYNLELDSPQQKWTLQLRPNSTVKYLHAEPKDLSDAFTLKYQVGLTVGKVPRQKLCLHEADKGEQESRRRLENPGLVHRHGQTRMPSPPAQQTRSLLRLSTLQVLCHCSPPLTLITCCPPFLCCEIFWKRDSISSRFVTPHLTVPGIWYRLHSWWVN